MRRSLMAILAIFLLLSVNGVFAAWVYTTNNAPDSNVNVPIELNEFVYPLFSVTYMVGEDIYLKDYHMDSTSDYTVIGAPTGFGNFKQWVNANGVAVTLIPKNNKNDYTKLII